MSYSSKVRMAQQMSIEVSGNELEYVVKLLNEGAKKSFRATSATAIGI